MKLVVPWLITLGLLALLCKLAFWQWQRAEEKTARLADLAARPTLSLAQALAKGDPNDWPVQVVGEWLPTAVLWDNRTLDGQVGYDLLQGLATAKGPLLVNRGWLAAPARRDQLPHLPLARGKVRLDGELRVPTPTLALADNVPEALGQSWRVQGLELAPLRQVTGLALLPAILNPRQGSDGLVPHWPVLVMPPEKHRAYALQWASLALALVVLFGFWLRTQRRSQ
ncbi:transmembrane cytochrome oxidase complex biogenesis factor [Gallaecimonas xiamenensis 3-C-1]|uniref:SURF1-like protein n=1 Tax=Gallaecimonas xiamenensis 3-C-1 TaxID=745411 RepID=K2K3G4_9GAMM|nr:transmembrane cytochrome oxidase complex biogenesis factor [Gallaecimonas xiamenensis 3-C-1]